MPDSVYRITIEGHLEETWSEWFEGLTVTPVDTGDTILTGPIVDQTALHGVLTKIRDLGLPLLSLSRISSEEEKKAPLVPISKHERRDE